MVRKENSSTKNIKKKVNFVKLIYQSIFLFSKLQLSTVPYYLNSI